MKFAVATLLLLALTACGSGTGQSSAPTLNDLRGQWVLVNYWAQWCKPCIEEIPELNAFDAKRTDVTVLGVNYEGATGDSLTQQIEALGIAFTTIEDPAAELGIPKPSVLPTTLLINPAGAVVKPLLGPQTEASLEAALQAAERIPAQHFTHPQAPN